MMSSMIVCPTLWLIEDVFMGAKSPYLQYLEQNVNLPDPDGLQG